VWVRGAGLLPEQPLATQVALGIESWRPYVWPVAGGTGMRPFQGRVALVLAALALVPLGAVWGRSARPRAAVVAALVLVALAGWSLARGPRGGALYALLWDWVPGFSATRVPARFMIVVSFATAALAGIGWAPLAARAGRWAPLATAGVLGAVAVDTGLHAVRVPLALAPDAAGPPAVTRWLAEHGEGRPVLELPVRRFAGDVPGAAAEQLYALRSLVHGLPILPGRSGYVPPSYEVLMAFARRLPDARAVDGLASLARLGWVVAYGAQVGPWSHPPPTLRLVATLGSDRVYRVEAGPVPDWQPALVARLRGAPEETTFAGTPLAPLTPRALENEVAAFGAPRRLRPGGTGIVSVAVRNAGHRPWPALALDPERVVVLRLAWRDAHGRRVRLALPPVRGIADTPPGAVATFQAAVPAPAEPGAYRLSARLTQGRVARRLGGQTRARVDVVR
jgi:hypothetical protein